MLFRLVQPVKRSGTRIPQFVKRIPADIRPWIAGRKLTIPLGDETISVRIGAKTESLRFSLRTADPATARIRQAEAVAHLEGIFQALRDDKPVVLTRLQIAALAGEIYRAWEGREAAEPSLRVEMTEDGPEVSEELLPPEFEAEVARATGEFFLRLEASDRPEDKQMLDRAITPLIDDALEARGIMRVDEASRERLFFAFLDALKFAFAIRQKRVVMDFTPDPKAASYPAWEAPTPPTPVEPPKSKVSLKGLVDDWWKEAQATGLKPSTHESYSNTMGRFIKFLKHDDASCVTPEDVIAFKDFRLSSKNPVTGKPISAKTVKDSDIAGLKSVFGWAVANRRIASNPAEGVTIKVGKRQKLREKGFTAAEAKALLTAASESRPGNDRPTTAAAKRWVPWLMAYSGARVGEIAQLRKEDVVKEGDDWVMNITPEAGPVKTNEARRVVVHPHVIEQGFGAFVAAAKAGHLFLTPSASGDVRGPLRGLKNRLTDAAREVVKDRNIAPNHGWRHRFKTIGMEAGIDHRILDVIQGHAPKTQGESYGDVTLKTIAAAIGKLPRYVVG